MTKFKLALTVAAFSAIYGPSAYAYEVPKEYCVALDESLALNREAEAQFEDWSARREWLAPRQEAIFEKVSKALGREYSVWFAQAMEQEWGEVCEAASLGRPALLMDHLKAATEEDRDKARSFLELNYVLRLDEGVEPFFDNDLYRSVSCGDAEWEGYQFVGCKLRSFTRSTERDTFAVANVGGEVMIIPVDAEASDRVEGLQSFEQSSIEGTPSMRIGHLVGDFSFVDYPTVKEKLD